MRPLRNLIYSLQRFSLMIKMISKENIIFFILVDKGVRDLQRVLLLSIILVTALWRRLILGRDP